jgi:hypothetical protein
MSLKNPAVFAEAERDFSRELQYLYLRLAAVTNLIQSLEDYERYRPKPSHLREKTA